MKVITSPQEMYSVSSALFTEKKRVGFVPTMGALHEGHFSLIRRSLQETDFTVVSIFVNPRQFNNPADLQNYPRPIEDDLKALEALGVDVAYTPDVMRMYPDEPVTIVRFGEMANSMEGKFRPGHFDGVGLVVLKLLNQVMPQRAYFGKKDLQQYLLVRQMVKDFSLAVEIVGCEIVRETTGLALSSRNMRLSPAGVKTASRISEGLFLGESLILSKKSIYETKSALLSFYREVDGLEIEYLEFVNVGDLTQADTTTPADSLAICVAGYVEGVRLIDNLYLRHD